MAIKNVPSAAELVDRLEREYLPHAEGLGLSPAAGVTSRRVVFRRKARGSSLEQPRTTSSRGAGGPSLV